MARTVAQAEAELRTAALDYAEADAHERNGDGDRWRGIAAGAEPRPLHPETQALVVVSSDKQQALTVAATNLLGSVRAELRAEAL